MLDVNGDWYKNGSEVRCWETKDANRCNSFGTEISLFTQKWLTKLLRHKFYVLPTRMKVHILMVLDSIMPSIIIGRRVEKDGGDQMITKIVTEKCSNHDNNYTKENFICYAISIPCNYHNSNQTFATASIYAKYECVRVRVHARTSAYCCVWS